MTSYTHFIGIDIGKFSFFVSIYNTKILKEFKNNSAGIAEFITEFQDILPTCLAVIETTGGFELELIYTLSARNFKVHRGDTRKIKNFIRSFGITAKTDALDAKALACYGYERAYKLAIFEPKEKRAIELFQLLQRRIDLKDMLVAEKNRAKSPASALVKHMIHHLIDTINIQVEEITAKIEFIINNDAVLKQKQEILKSIPGIGNIVAFELLILLPELGSLCRRKIASLAGLAPRAYESGTYKGYRKTGNGRTGIKPVLFLAAMAARNSRSRLKVFYEKLITNGKAKMVAITALMRKILTIANAKLKSLHFSLKHS